MAAQQETNIFHPLKHLRHKSCQVMIDSPCFPLTSKETKEWEKMLVEEKGVHGAIGPS